MVRMPRWLLVVAIALSLAALLLIANLPDSGSNSDNFKLNLEMPSVEHYVWMGCHNLPVGAAGRQGPLLRGVHCGTSQWHATSLAAVRATDRTVASAWSPFCPNP